MASTATDVQDRESTDGARLFVERAAMNQDYCRAGRRPTSAPTKSASAS